jgi:hypothetical protein
MNQEPQDQNYTEDFSIVTASPASDIAHVSIARETLKNLTQVSAEWIRFYIETECLDTTDLGTERRYDITIPANTILGPSQAALHQTTVQRMLTCLIQIQQNPELNALVDYGWTRNGNQIYFFNRH